MTICITGYLLITFIHVWYSKRWGFQCGRKGACSLEVVDGDCSYIGAPYIEYGSDTFSYLRKVAFHCYLLSGAQCTVVSTPQYDISRDML